MKVRISYSRNKYDIGRVMDLPDDEAKLLIREGRARPWYGYDEPATPPVTTVAPASLSSPAVQAETSQTPASTSTPAKATGVKRTSTTTPPE